MDGFAANPASLHRAGEAAGNYVKGKAGATEKILSDSFKS